MGYDGSVRIKTDIDAKSAAAQLAALENRMVKTADKIASLRSKMDALKDAKIPTQEYAEFDKELSKLGAEYDRLAERQQKFLSTGGKESSSTYKRLEHDLNRVDERQDQVIAKMRELEASGKAFTLGSSTEEFANLSRQMQYAQNDMSVMIDRHDLLIAKQRQAQDGYKRLGDTAKNVFSKLGNTISKIATGSFKKLGTAAKDAFTKITQHANKSSSTLSSFGGRIKKLVASFLIFNQIRKLFSAAVNAIKEGFSNLYNENDRFKSSVDNIKASVLTLKNTLASAFRPLVDIAIPYIQIVLDYMTKLVDAAGQFIAAITGQKTYTKAIKQTTAALKEESKASNKQLSSLDKLNNLTSQSGGNADSGTGGMFEEVPISNRWSDIAQWFKDMWENADFTELGALLGQKLKDALDSIPWDGIKKIAGKIGKSIATLINGFVEIEGLANSIGTTIGEFVNTGIVGLTALFDNTHWDSVGKFIGDGLNGIVDTIDWEGIGHLFASKWNAFFETIGEAARTFDWTNWGLDLAGSINTFILDFDWAENGARLGDLVKGLLDSIISFLENVNWQELGNGVADFIGSIDWSGIMTRLAEGIGTVLGGLAAFLWGLIEDAWNSVVDWWQETAFEDGQFTIKGLLNGIQEVMSNIDRWITDNIVEPFLNGLLGEDTWADIKESGKNLIEGLYQGIKDFFSDPLGWIKDNIVDPFVEKFKDLFGIHSPSTVMAEIGKYIISGLLNGLREKWDDIVSWITEKADWLISKVQSVFDSIGSFKSSGFGGAVSGLFGNLTYSLSPTVAALSNVDIPAYATGQVIPRTMKQHLAILGDNSRETEVVSPLSTMKQAFKEAWSEMGGGSSDRKIVINLVATLDGRAIFETTQEYAEDFFDRTGKAPYPI